MPVFTNRWLWLALAGSLLQVAAVELPFMNDAFKTTPLGIDDWGVCVGLASTVLWADELFKLAKRAQRRRAGA